MSMRQWTEGMGEVSGLGGDYEECCRAMVLAGVEWTDKHPGQFPEFSEIAGVFGLINPKDGPAKELVDVVVQAANRFGKGDPSGAMVHATVGHVLFIASKGWDVYVARMLKDDKPRQGRS